MPVQHIKLNNLSLAIDTASADLLLQLGSGDAALLYLYLLRNGGEYDPAAAGRLLRKDRGQLDTAMAQLQEMKLAAGALLPRAEELPPQPDQAPEYTTQDILSELQDTSSPFPALLREVESVLGKKLSTSQTSALLELYDHVGLPTEVLLTLVNWLNEKNRKKYGTGKRLSMSYVKRVGYQWKEHGYDTLEAADEYIRSCDLRESQVGAILAACGIHGRAPLSTEGKYIAQWIDWRFPPESVAIAYDITMTKLGHMDWRYCNAILRRWNEKRLHTPEEVQTERRSEPAPGGQAQPAVLTPPDNRENQQEMRRLLERLNDEN
jgi:hypothetical protein